MKLKFNQQNRIIALVLMLMLVGGGLYLVLRSHAATCALPGDANCDGAVNLTDLSILATNYGKIGATWATGDFNGDGAVNLTDLSILAKNYGTSAANALSVNASSVVNPFNPAMKGIALANWTFTKNWGKPFVGQIQGLPQAIQAINPGLIRYAGGLWANWVGFDATKIQMTPNTAWTYDGFTYSFNYGTDELASLDQFAKSVNASVMIQVNISNNDPTMWANLVAYAKQHSLTSLRYYEFGNELDLETANGASDAIDPATYASRVTVYENAMLAADSTVKFVAGASANATDIVRNNWASGGNTVSQYITQAVNASHAA